MRREHSSVGSEHLPYKQRVGGSNPSAPTNFRKTFRKLRVFFVFILFYSQLYNLFNYIQLHFTSNYLLNQAYKKAYIKTTGHKICPAAGK